MIYEIKFSEQSRHNTYDSDSVSIRLTLEQYESLPELSIETFNSKCKFEVKLFSEQVRHPSKYFPAIWISNDDWKLTDVAEIPDSYINNNIYWMFVCIDSVKDLWIAFTYYDLATVSESFASTVSVSFPSHGDVYKLDKRCKEEIVDRLF